MKTFTQLVVPMCVLQSGLTCLLVYSVLIFYQTPPTDEGSQDNMGRLQQLYNLCEMLERATSKIYGPTLDTEEKR